MRFYLVCLIAVVSPCYAVREKEKLEEGEGAMEGQPKFTVYGGVPQHFRDKGTSWLEDSLSSLWDDSTGSMAVKIQAACEQAWHETGRSAYEVAYHPNKKYLVFVSQGTAGLSGPPGLGDVLTMAYSPDARKVQMRVIMIVAMS